jgi:hypothetical protein
MTTMTTMRSLVFALLALHAAASQACYSAPANQLIGTDEQLGQATNVAVAQVIGATPLDGQHRRIPVPGAGAADRPAAEGVYGNWPRPIGPYDKDTSFHDHADFAFWARGGGRTMNDSDCHIHPSFIPGNTYLVFLDMPPTRRSFEKLDMFGSIVNHDDKWLAHVKALAGRRYGQHP